jgi:7,8-dihydropterin-6-yl-methyl-4-(beta-D-ribofuranosyl)aminobenzene 5'-phosphate synthase
MNPFQITVVVENTARKPGLLAEHGLSFLIEVNGEKVLFDTGQGLALKHNAEIMDLRLGEVKTVVLSHGHYDHSGGLATALSMMNHPAVYAHPSVTEPKFVCYQNMKSRAIGMPEADQKALSENAEWIHTTEPIKLPGGLRLTGPIPRETGFENAGGPFFLNEEGTELDWLDDDQAAFFETKNGTVVILGCAHAGVINTLRHIRRLTNKQPIHTVIGGMHLHSASNDRMKKTIKALRKLDIGCMFLCHCTGFAATAELWNEFPGKVRPCPTGTVISMNKDSSNKGH